MALEQCLVCNRYSIKTCRMNKEVKSNRCEREA